MKTFVLAAVAALGLASVANADDFDSNTLAVTATTGNLEFTAETAVGTSLDGAGDDFTLGVKATVLTFGETDVKVFGQYMDIEGTSAGALGAELVYVMAGDGTALELTGQAAYLAPTSDFGDGEVFLTPSANLGVDLTDTFTVYGEVGYQWNASEDFASVGGYGEVGLDVALTETVTLTPSISKEFDTDNDDLSAGLELQLAF